MKLRLMSITLFSAITGLCVVATAFAPAHSSIAAPNISASAITSIHLAGSTTYTVYLPIINYCYPPLSITDPGFASQPDMSLIHADYAWTHCAAGSASIIVAVIDTGVSLNHPDLQPNVMSGANFVTSEYPLHTTAQDGNGHGSNVAGIIGAALNGVGIVGVAPSTHILPVRVLDNSGSGYTSDVVAGIDYAADRAQILNLSLGGAFDDYFIHNAIDYAVNTEHRLVVAAAGNCGGSYGSNSPGCNYTSNTWIYPGAYSVDYPGGVVAVAAADNNDQHASFSNSDPYVTVAAPGVGIYSDYLNNGFASFSGTSQATPHVAGLAALIWSRHPEYSAAQVEYVITSTAIDLGSAGRDNDYGWGRIDVQAALTSIGVTAVHTASGPASIDLPRPIDHRAAKIASGRVLIKFKSGVNAMGIDQALISIGNLKIEKEIDRIGVKVLSVPSGQEWTLVDRLRLLSSVEFAEPDYAVQLIP